MSIEWKPGPNLALVGNSSLSALIDPRGNVVWTCLPRFDSDPVFDALLKGATLPDDGFYLVDLYDFDHSEQGYLTNTAVVRTRLFDTRGGIIDVLDFAPRFHQHGRTFRPLTFVRLLRPVSGSPRVRVLLRPTSALGGSPPGITWGSNHIRYVLPHVTLRLTTDASITALLDETAFVVERPLTLILGPDETLPSGIAETGHRFLEETVSHWQEWVRYLGIP
ncbi:MAG: trehalase-like domain-containing protein, partial [Vicinamibacteria bacterium]